MRQPGSGISTLFRRVEGGWNGLLKNTKITRPDPSLVTVITYLTMALGFLYLVPVIRWHSQYVVAWRLSNTPEADFGAWALGHLTPSKGFHWRQTIREYQLKREGGFTGTSTGIIARSIRTLD